MSCTCRQKWTWRSHLWPWLTERLLPLCQLTLQHILLTARVVQQEQDATIPKGAAEPGLASALLARARAKVAGMVMCVEKLSRDAEND